MKIGDRLVIFLDKTSPDFKNTYNDAKLLPTNKIFDFNTWQNNRDTYKSILKDNEDVDFEGNKGYFDKRDKFTIVILSTVSSDEDMKSVIDNIPCIENFDIVKVNN